MQRINCSQAHASKQLWKVLVKQGNNYIVGHKPSRRKHDAFAIFWKMRFDVAPKRILEDSELGTRNDTE